MKQIKGQFEIDGIKRFYVKGAVIKINCPNCGKELETDLGENYLSYPEIGKPVEVFFECEDCNGGKKYSYFKVDATVKSAEVIIEYDPDSVKES